MKILAVVILHVNHIPHQIRYTAAIDRSNDTTDLHFKNTSSSFILQTITVLRKRNRMIKSEAHEATA